MTITHLRIIFKLFVYTQFVIISLFSLQVNAQLPDSEKFWNPIVDEVYLQEVSQKISHDQPVTGVGTYGDQVFGVIGGQLYVLEGDLLVNQKKAPQNINRLISIDKKLWALTANNTWSFNGKTWDKITDLSFVDMCMHQGVLHAATTEEIFKLEKNQFISIKPEGGYLNSDITTLMEDGTQIHTDPVRLGPINKIESYSNSHRDDLFLEPGYTSYEGGIRAISPRESSVKRGSRPATQLDANANGSQVMEPTGFLRDYWMGRYYGFIGAPTTTDRSLLEVAPKRLLITDQIGRSFKRESETLYYLEYVEQLYG